MNSVIGRGLCLRSLLASGLCLLVGSGRTRVHIGNASLGAGVDILDRFAVLSGQVIELIGLVDNWRGLLTNVVLTGAADRRRHACCQCDD